MTYTEHTEEYKGFTIRIEQDTDAQSPADWDQVATIYTRHSRNFAIGENGGYEPAEGDESLPIYAYVHGVIALSTTPFSCSWDSRKAGCIVMTRAKIISEYGDDSEASREKARSLMRAEVQAWADYHEGNVWGFVVEDAEGNHLDSCWGFYGDYNAEGGALHEARSIADWYAHKRKTTRMERIKTMIRNRVPLDIRQTQLAKL